MPWAGAIALQADNPNGTIVFAPERATVSLCRLMPRRTMSALSWDTGIISPFQDPTETSSQKLLLPPRTLPNGLRVSGERGGEADERVRCTRVLGALFIDMRP